MEKSTTDQGLSRTSNIKPKENFVAAKYESISLLNTEHWTNVLICDDLT